MSHAVKDDPMSDIAEVRPLRIPGELGLWALILSDSVVFTLFFAAYLFDRGRHPKLFAEGQHTLEQTYGIINTLLLLTSSFLVVTGVRAVRQRWTTVAPWLFVGAIACGVGFGGVKFLEYGEKLSHGIGPGTNSFYTHYFTMTGLHFFHVLVGLVLLVLMARLSHRAVLSTKQLNFIEGCGCFWHMVDFLWIIIFPLLYLIR